MESRTISFPGLTKKGAQIYQAGLMLGTTSVQELARKSGLKRPTVYLHLDDLVQQGIFELVPMNKKTYYRAADPEILESRFKKGLSAFQAELPNLSALRGNMLGKPQVRIAEGKEAVLSIYTELKKAHSLRFWSNVGPVLGPFHNEYMELAETIRKNSINAKEIIADTKESRRYSRLLSKVAGPTYSARTATAEGIENDTGIFGNVVIIFRLHELNFFAVRIEDKTIADTMRAIFDMSWKTAKIFR